jgi:Arc/MetJ-type ribon-helix-helix transcriptional regulator
MASERVTITLPEEMVQEIDGRERNRSRFVQQAVARELERLRQQELQRSLDNPHTDSEAVAESGFSEWADLAAAGDQELLDTAAGKEIRWDADRGWIEADE